MLRYHCRNVSCSLSAAALPVEAPLDDLRDSQTLRHALGFRQGSEP